MNFEAYFDCTALRHCEERYDTGCPFIRSSCDLKLISDAVISFRLLTIKSFLSCYLKSSFLLVPEMRLLRGCSSDEFNKYQIHSRLRLAMTNVRVDGLMGELQ
jgi:hypothetical protein